MTAQPGPDLQHASTTLRPARSLRRLILKASEDSPGGEAAAEAAVGSVRPAEYLSLQPDPVQAMMPS